MPDQNLFGSQISDDAVATLVAGTVIPVLTPNGSAFDNEKTLLSSLGSALQSLSLLTHGGLTGLTTGDPHTQYLLLAGRAAGQILLGIANAVQLTVRGFSTQTSPIFTAEKSDGTDLFAVLNSGVLQVPLAHNAGADATGGTAVVASGTYVPSMTLTANLTSASSTSCHWMRVGQVVTVSGHFEADPVAGATLTDLGFSLPIPSNFAGFYQLAGAGFADGSTAFQPLLIKADTVNDRAQILWYPIDGVGRNHQLSFTYVVV